MLSINLKPLDAFFESTSGFTTTGFTVIQNLSSLPHSILFWRSFIQWLAGLGILTFFLFITYRSESQLWQLFTAESHKIETTRPVPNIFRSIKILWSIYALFTLLEIILLIVVQVSFFDALIHSLTTLSTAGFSNYDASIAHFAKIGHPYYKVIEYIIIVFMLLGGINFLIHYKVLKGDIKAIFKNFELRYFWSILIIVLSVILLGQYLDQTLYFHNLESVFRKSLFTVVSILTTTGYEVEPLTSSFFPAVARQLFLFLMLIGGCVGSTSGGVKVIRFGILTKLFNREIKKLYLPQRAITIIKVDNKLIKQEEIHKISALFFVWLMLILFGGLVTSLFSNLDAIQSISGMFSAVSNIGPTYFDMKLIQTFSPIIKLTYIFGMIAGRLELLPLFVIFTRKAWK